MADLTPSGPVVSVIVVNYNGAAHLDECLQALGADPGPVPFEVLIVDNASDDGSLAVAQRWAAGVPGRRVLPSPVNRGYAGAVNFGRPEARGRYLAVLNPDVVVADGWLRPLVRFLDEHPQAGAANPLILLHAGQGRVNAAGQDVHVTGLGFNRGLGQPRERFGRQPHPVSGLHGSAVVIRRSALEAIGGWDESGFLYHEDVELSWRLLLAGYDLYCVPEAVVQHKYHLSMYPEKLFLLERNRQAMLATHLERPARLALAPLLLLTELLMWAYCLLRGPAFLRAKWQSVRWVLRQGPALRQRQESIRRLRRRGDAQVLRRLRWGYAWGQFLTLGRERGDSTRQPAGGLPVKVSAE